MGYARIIWIYDDDLRHLSQSPNGAETVGQAIIDLYERDADGQANVNFPSSSPGVSQVGRFHSTAFVPIAWHRNCLMKASELSEDARQDLLKSFDVNSTAEPSESGAATKYWGLLTSRIDKVDSLGQRVLVSLFKSPMAAVTWEAAGAPCSMQDLKSSISSGSKTASYILSFLENHLAHWEDSNKILGAPDSEIETHLRDIVTLLLEFAGSSAEKQVVRNIHVNLIVSGKHISSPHKFDDLRDYFADQFGSDVSHRTRFIDQFGQDPGKALSWANLIIEFNANP